MKTQYDHLIGRNLKDIAGRDIGTFYPMVDEQLKITGFFSAELGTPGGYRLDESLQAFRQITAEEAERELERRINHDTPLGELYGDGFEE